LKEGEVGSVLPRQITIWEDEPGKSRETARRWVDMIARFYVKAGGAHLAEGGRLIPLSGR
jgi:hypothetical protein